MNVLENKEQLVDNKTWNATYKTFGKSEKKQSWKEKNSNRNNNKKPHNCFQYTIVNVSNLKSFYLFLCSYFKRFHKHEFDLVLFKARFHFSLRCKYVYMYKLNNFLYDILYTELKTYKTIKNKATDDQLNHKYN